MNVVGGIKGPVRNPVWAMTDDEWDAVVGLNLRGTFLCTQLVAGTMMARRSGKIVNIASTSWADEDGLHPHYAAAKAGVVAFTRSVAAQLCAYNVNVERGSLPGPRRPATLAAVRPRKATRPTRLWQRRHLSPGSTTRLTSPTRCCSLPPTRAATSVVSSSPSPEVTTPRCESHRRRRFV